MDGLSKKQRETDEHVHAIEEDLYSVKAAVDGRLSAVEGSLAGLKSKLYEEMSETQERMTKEIQDCLLREIHSTTLRVDAPSFIPSDVTAATVHVGNASPGSSAKQQRPAPFDGKVAWDVYKA